MREIAQSYNISHQTISRLVTFRLSCVFRPVLVISLAKPELAGSGHAGMGADFCRADDSVERPRQPHP